MPPPADEAGRAETPKREARLSCATCKEEFSSRNQLHRHLRETNHRVTDDGDKGKRARRRQLEASEVRQAMICHFGPRCGPDQVDIPVMSVDKELRGHPGPKVKENEIKACDKRWVDVGSGIFSRTFSNVRQLPITTRQGPSIADIHSRRVWDLNTGKLIDDCILDDTPDQIINRQLDEATNVRVELTLKGALDMFLKKGPDICEIFSQPRVCQEAAMREYGGTKLRPGWSLDLTMKDPESGEPWDLSKVHVQNRVRQLVRTTQPYCIIGSPPCTAFSPLQNISKFKRDPNIVKEELRQAKAHVRFCIEIYLMQVRGHRHFVHEHPERSRAWQLPEMKELLLRPEVGSVILHMCAFGMTSTDEMGTAPVKKATRIISTSDEVLKQVNRQCANERGGPRHRHVPLVQGRARAAQVYPRLLGERLCEGIAAQKRLDMLGMASRPR